MAKQYKKKPLIIEAVQFIDNAERIEELANFIDDQDLVIDYSDKDNPKLKIETLEGVMEASVNDYVIKGTKGEFYPCKPDIFKSIYEEV